MENEKLKKDQNEERPRITNWIASKFTPLTHESNADATEKLIRSLQHETRLSSDELRRQVLI